MSSAEEDTDAARRELAECEKEIASVKAMLRNLGPAGGDGDGPNRLSVVWIKVSCLLSHLCWRR